MKKTLYILILFLLLNINGIFNINADDYETGTNGHSGNGNSTGCTAGYWCYNDTKVDITSAIRITIIDGFGENIYNGTHSIDLVTRANISDYNGKGCTNRGNKVAYKNGAPCVEGNYYQEGVVFNTRGNGFNDIPSVSESNLSQYANKIKKWFLPSGAGNYSDSQLSSLTNLNQALKYMGIDTSNIKSVYDDLVSREARILIEPIIFVYKSDGVKFAGTATEVPIYGRKVRLGFAAADRNGLNALKLERADLRFEAASGNPTLSNYLTHGFGAYIINIKSMIRRGDPEPDKYSNCSGEYKTDLSCGQAASKTTPYCSLYEGKVSDDDGNKITYCTIKRTEQITSNPFPVKKSVRKGMTFPFYEDYHDIEITKTVTYTKEMGICPKLCTRYDPMTGNCLEQEDNPDCRTIENSCNNVFNSIENDNLDNLTFSISTDAMFNAGVVNTSEVSRSNSSMVKQRTYKAIYNIREIYNTKWTGAISLKNVFGLNKSLGKVFVVDSNARTGEHNFEITATTSKSGITNTINYSCPYNVNYIDGPPPSKCKQYKVGTLDYICCINEDDKRCPNRCEGLTGDAKDCCLNSSLAKCNSGGSSACSGLTGNDYYCCINREDEVCENCEETFPDKSSRDYICCIDRLNQICGPSEGTGYFVRQISLSNPFPRTALNKVGNNWLPHVKQTELIEMRNKIDGPIVTNTYNQDPEYSFELNTATINLIKYYNTGNLTTDVDIKNNKYLDDSIDDDGKSSLFINYLVDKYGDNVVLKRGR